MTIANNNRIFYACQGVEIDNEAVEGVTSVSLNTSIDFEQVFQFGVLEIFENIEGVASADLTIEKFIASGLNTVSIGAFACASNPNTKKGNWGVVPPSGASDALNKMALCRSDYKIFVLPETHTSLKDSPSAVGASYLLSSGNITEYSISQEIEGPATESITISSLRTVAQADTMTNDATFRDEASASIGVARRQDFVHQLGNTFQSGIQSISYSVSLGSEDLFELGRKQPYARVATFPAEVSLAVTFLPTSGFLSPQILGLNPTAAELNKDITKPSGCLTKFGPVAVSGDKFRLISTSFGGGDAGGGNATVTQNYQTFNSLAVYRLN